MQPYITVANCELQRGQLEAHLWTRTFTKTVITQESHTLHRHFIAPFYGNWTARIDSADVLIIVNAKLKRGTSHLNKYQLADDP